MKPVSLYNVTYAMLNRIEKSDTLLRYQMEQAIANAAATATAQQQQSQNLLLSQQQQSPKFKHASVSAGRKQSQAVVSPTNSTTASNRSPNSSSNTNRSRVSIIGSSAQLPPLKKAPVSQRKAVSSNDTDNDATDSVQNGRQAHRRGSLHR
jgi:hypothetical protein